MIGTVITALSIAALVPAAAAMLIAEHGEARGIVDTGKAASAKETSASDDVVRICNILRRLQALHERNDAALRTPLRVKGGRARMWTLVLGMLIGVVLTMLIVGGLLLIAGATAVPEEEISAGPVSSDVDRTNVDVYG